MSDPDFFSTKCCWKTDHHEQLLLAYLNFSFVSISDSRKEAEGGVFIFFSIILVKSNQDPCKKVPSSAAMPVTEYSANCLLRIRL